MRPSGGCGLNSTRFVRQVEEREGWPPARDLRLCIPAHIDVIAYHVTRQVTKDRPSSVRRTAQILILTRRMLIAVELSQEGFQELDPGPRFSSETVRRSATPLTKVRSVQLAYSRSELGPREAHAGSVPMPRGIAVSIEVEDPPPPLNSMTALLDSPSAWNFADALTRVLEEGR
jgi:hypothetical protein